MLINVLIIDILMLRNILYIKKKNSRFPPGFPKKFTGIFPLTGIPENSRGNSLPVQFPIPIPVPVPDFFILPVSICHLSLGPPV
jgi:hypothetical protein